MTEAGSSYGYRIAEEKHDNDVQPSTLWAGFTDKTSSHGLPHLHTSRSTFKCFYWLIFTLAATGVLGYHCYRIVSSYISFDLSTEVKVVDQNKLLFPAVTICNNNMLRYSQIVSGSAIDTFIQNELSSTDEYSEDDEFALQNKIISTLGSLSDAQKQPFGHQLEDMVVDCYFNGIECNLTTDFEYFFSSKHGNCYTYNSIRRSMTNMSYVLRGGSTFGLRMLLNIEKDEYVDTLTNVAAIRILVHNQTDMPFPDESGQLLPVGSLSNVVVRKTVFNKYKDCKQQDSTDLPNAYSKPYSVIYSQDSCSLTCVQKNIVANCSCYSPEIPYYSDLFPEIKVANHSCKYEDDEWDCLLDQWEAYQDAKLDCNGCINSCQSAFFDMQITSSPWPVDAFLDNLAAKLSTFHSNLFDRLQDDGSGNFTMQSVRENLLDVSVYFDRLSVLTITESLKYELYQFISDLGGAFGLWIGFSFLTFMEVWEFFMDLLVYCCCRSGKKKRDQRVTSVQMTKINPN